VSAAQALLFPDPRPLVERFGPEFFRQLPESPGVYLMRGADEAVLYVGKAKNLRKRLCSYRVANPERLPRRTLRLLRSVTRIDMQQCPDESSALARESELLLSLRPKFNRAGTWPAKPRFLAWRCLGDKLQMMVIEAPESGWLVYGPLGSKALALHAVLLRLLWGSFRTECGLSTMPLGWFKGSCPGQTELVCGNMAAEAAGMLTKVFAGRPEVFLEWIRQRMNPGSHRFDLAVIASDSAALEQLTGGLGLGGASSSPKNTA
jgi:excinuclease UvrABC nuclease subunit